MCRGGCAYEIKWDGWRAAAFVSADDVYLQSRSFKPLAPFFPDLIESLSQLPAGTVIDGELRASWAVQANWCRRDRAAQG
jgi:ATP-dependent DNA ligase